MNDLSQLSDQELMSMLGGSSAASSMSDEELLSALGVQPERPALGIRGGPMRMVNKAFNAMKGDAAEDAPAAAGLANFKTAAASMFGSDEDYASALRRQFPDATFRQDENGNAMIEVDGQAYYINQPGLDVEDVTRGAGKVASFVPAARLAGMTKGLFGRAAVGGAGAAATDMAMQKASGRDEIDPGQSATVGAFGAAGELAAPFVGRVGALLRGRDAESIARGQEIARMAGMQQIPDEMAKRVGQRALQARGDIDPRKLLAEAEFDVRYTRGQLTEDPRFLNQEELLKQNAATEGVFRRLDDQNYEAQRQFTDRFAERMGANVGDGPLEAAGRVRERLSDAERQLHGQIGDAYSRVGSAAVQREAMNGLSERLQSALQSEGRILDDMLTPAAARAIRDVSEQVSKLPDDMSAVTIDLIENQRKRIGSLYGAASNQADRAALSIVKREFDNWMDEAVDSALFSGDAEALTALKEARAIRAKYGALFQGRDEAGKVVQKLLAEDRTPEQVAQFVLGLSDRVSPAGAANVVRRIKEAAPDAADDLRQAMFLKLVKGFSGADQKGRGTLVSTLRQSLNGKGRTVMNELFAPEELNEISRFAQAVDWLVAKGDRGRSSGTPERIARYLGVMGRIPGLNQLLGPLREGMAINTARQATTQVPRANLPSMPTVPAALEAYGQGL